jgi:hypothetical protein
VLILASVFMVVDVLMLLSYKGTRLAFLLMLTTKGLYGKLN